MNQISKATGFTGRSGGAAQAAPQPASQVATPPGGVKPAPAANGSPQRVPSANGQSQRAPAADAPSRPAPAAAPSPRAPAAAPPQRAPAAAPPQRAPAAATQQDLKALHKSIVTMVATLGDGLGAQAAQTALADRRALERRLDDMAQALNGMEGALRIELTPHLRQMMDEAVATVAAARPSRWRRGLTLVAVLAIGVAVGTAGSHEISAAARAVTDRVAVQFTPAAADGPRSGASVGGRID